MTDWPDDIRYLRGLAARLRSLAMTEATIADQLREIADATDERADRSHLRHKRAPSRGRAWVQIVPGAGYNRIRCVREEMIPLCLAAVFVSREARLVFRPARDAGLVGGNR
jgi:hypothetical protein